METKLTKIFKQAKYEANPKLASAVWNAVMTYDKRIARIKLWIFSTLGFVSLVGLVPAITKLSSDLSKSGLYEYFSLLFGSNGALASYWKDLVFSLAESLPVMSIILALSLIFVFILSLRYVMKQIWKLQLINFATL